MANWTINNTPLADIGLTLTSWPETPMSIDKLRLNVVAEDYAGDIPAGLGYSDVVTLRKDAQVMFTGRVTKTPRNCSATSEGWSYEVSSHWWDLDNLTYQAERKYFNGLDGNGDPQTVTKLMGYVILGRDGETTGARIEKVLDFAIVQGANFQKGTIDAGIVWAVNEHKDQTCGQVIRDYMRLVPDQVAWIDYSFSPPKFNVTAQANLTPKTLDINAGDIIESHTIDKLDTESPNGIVIRYEIPETVDGQTYVKIVEDTAGATTGFGVLTMSVPLEGSNITTEKAVAEVRNIPENKTGGIPVKEWWLEHHTELKKLTTADAGLLAKITLPTADDAALGVTRHTLVLPPPPEPPKPLDENAILVPPSDQLSDYPRELIGGALPDWTRRKTRQMDCSVTLMISKADMDALAPAVRKVLRSIFKDAKFVNNAVHYIANLHSSINATNATNREYSNVASYTAAQDPPTGIAAAVLAQYARTKHAGSITLIEEEITKALKPGDALNITGGRPEWATMKEIVQSVKYDVDTGRTVANFGPATQLGVEDMIDRLQAFKRVPSSYGFDPDKDIEPTIGGISDTPRETNTSLEDLPPAQSHYFGPLEVFRHANGNAEIIPVPTHFHEISHTTIKRHDITLNGTALTADPPPQMSLTGGSKWKIYCKFDTDDQGVINSAVTAHFTTGAVPASTRHIPASDSDSGTTGVYHKLIGIYDVPYSPADPIIFEPVSSPSWEVIDRKFSNLGSGAKVHKSTNKDKQEFRSLKGSDGASGTSGTLKQGKVVVEEEGNNIVTKVFFAEDDLGGGGPSSGETGLTGDFKFKNHSGGDISTFSFDEGWYIGNPLPDNIKIQQAIIGDDFLAVDNVLSQVRLLNKNQAKNKPKRGETGWYAHYVVVAGEVGGASYFCTEPTALALDASGNPTQIPLQVTVQSTNAQAPSTAPPVTETS